MIQTVQYLHCQHDDAGQRLDNFLIARYKSVPKSRIYRAIRKGEVRVNKSRAKQTQRLVTGDVVRVPPMTISASKAVSDEVDGPSIDVLFQDDSYMIVNKPAGVPVHSGSNFHRGIIDILCARYGDSVRLVHRLDRDVSGCLVIAKNRHALLSIQRMWLTDAVKKIYHAVVFYDDFPEFRSVDSDLRTESGKLQSARTEFVVLDRSDDCLLLEVYLHTGRKHQIRKHLSSVGLPIVGDKRHGDFAKNRTFSGLKQQMLALHARTIVFDIDGIMKRSTAVYPDHFKALVREQFPGQFAC